MYINKDEKDLKRELEIDVHKVDLSELYTRFGTHHGSGLTRFSSLS